MQLARRGAWLLLLAGCSPPSDHGGATPAGGAGQDGGPVFSRGAFAVAQPDAGLRDASSSPVPTTADPAAMAEILAAAAKAVPASDDREGILGTDTRPRPVAAGDVSPDGGTSASPRAEPVKTARVRIGAVSSEPELAGPAAERAARAQLYWPLVQRCRTEQGAILPPEVVRLSFSVDHDGYIIASSILTLPTEARYADAARCMARELAMIPFHAPVGALQITIAVPSID